MLGFPFLFFSFFFGKKYKNRNKGNEIQKKKKDYGKISKIRIKQPMASMTLTITDQIFGVIQNPNGLGGDMLKEGEKK